MLGLYSKYKNASVHINLLTQKTIFFKSNFETAFIEALVNKNINIWNLHKKDTFCAILLNCPAYTV
jgi:hypothetical protein